jgi:mannose-6-phosphate isomerase
MLVLMNVIKKPWGHETIVTQNEMYVVKQIYVKAGHRLSLQFHQNKTESIFVVYGGYIETNDIQEKISSIEVVDDREIFLERKNLDKLAPVHIPPGTIHRIGAEANSDALFVEVSSTELSDVIRLRDDYGRS